MPELNKIDAAVTTSMFLGSLAFADTTEDYRVSLMKRSVPFSWLGTQLGLGSLLAVFQSRTGATTQSIWLSMFEGVADGLLLLNDERSGTEGIPVELATVFDVNESSVCDSHDYLKVIRRLCRLLPIDPESEMALLQYMQFVDGMSSQFLGLVNALDVRALMLLSYWLALLCTKDCWWSRLRAQTDCWAICEHLEKYGDPSLWRFMDFPAAACGYPYQWAAPTGRDLVDMFRSEQE